MGGDDTGRALLASYHEFCLPIAVVIGNTRPSDQTADNSSTGGQKQRGIITYGLSANRQNPFAHAANDAVFNTFRRFRSQVLYIVPPMIIGYYAMDWAIHR
jgi:ubiquinol-cytochrome c reductase subunit 8